MDMLSKVGGAILLAETEWRPKSGVSKDRAMALAAIEAMREQTEDMASTPAQIASRLMSPASESALWKYDQVKALIIRSVEEERERANLSK